MYNIGMCENDDSSLDPALAAGLAELPDEQAAALRAAARRFAMLSASEQAHLRGAALAETFEHQARQVVDVALDAARRGRVAALLPRLDEMAASFALATSAASPHADLVRFVRCVAALLRNQKRPEEVPPCYARQFALLEAAVREPKEGQA